MKVTINVPNDNLDSALSEGLRYGRGGGWIGGYFRGRPNVGATTVSEEDGGREYVIDAEKLNAALVRMAENPRLAHHFAALLTGKSDAETGDVLIQLACFGALRYG